MKEVIPRKIEIPVLKEIQGVEKALENMKKIIQEDVSFFSQKSFISATLLNVNDFDDQKILLKFGKNGNVLRFYFLKKRAEKGGDASYYFDAKTGEFLVKILGR